MKQKGFRNLMKWAKPYAWLLFFIIFTTVINPLLYSYVPQFIKYVVDVIFGSITEGSITLPSFLTQYYDSISDQLTAVLVVGISLLLFQVIRGSIMFLDGYNKGRLAERIAYDMRNRMYSHIQNLPFSYHSNIDTGDLIQRCTSDIETIKSFLSSQLPQILYIIGSFTFGVIQMGQINVDLMLVTLAIVPISTTASIIYFRYVKRKFEQIEGVEAKMTTALQENVNGVRVVKAFANENFEIDKFRRQNRDYSKESQKLNIAIAWYWGASDFMTTMQYAVTVGVAVILAQKNLISSGDIIACLMYIGMLVWPIRGLGRIIGDFGKATVAANRIEEILAIPSEYEQDGTETPVVTGDIVFDDVSFKFPDTDKHLLDGVSFVIKSGETVAIVGKTGSGKSTIANLLVRMLDYTKGSVRIDGVELKNIKKHWIRENIGIILQDPFLYATTVFENIKIGLKDIDSEKVYNAAKTAAIHKDITAFDEGYNTLVGEKGVTLSGGQKQRIAIARMLILDKPVMIFDDSLSAVDTTTDLMIRNALKAKNSKLTSIIITHRITTAKEADKIIVLENGKVTAVGNHQELAAKEGLYQKLWAIQGALESEFVKVVEGGGSHE
ncbi:MAG TPA: ABC transporter ATP-binding protein [Acholeplasmatales bacterium]|nr:ABC transporter ATP-binding protein [Acholeplasmatales bacterium]